MKLVNDDLSKEVAVETYGGVPTYSGVFSAIKDFPDGILFIVETGKEMYGMNLMSCFSKSPTFPQEDIYGQVDMGNYYYPVILDKGLGRNRRDFNSRAERAINKYLYGKVEEY